MSGHLISIGYDVDPTNIKSVDAIVDLIRKHPHCLICGKTTYSLITQPIACDCIYGGSVLFYRVVCGTCSHTLFFDAIAEGKGRSEEEIRIGGY